MQPTPKPDALQRYGADLSDLAYSQERVRQMLDDAHAHYEAQVRPLAGLARPEAQWPLVMGDARIDAMASAGKVALLSASLTQADARIAEIRDLLKEARKIIRASSSRNLAKDWDQRATAAIAKELRRAAE